MESTRIKIVGMGSKEGIAMQMVADLDASGHDCTWFNAVSYTHLTLPTNSRV